MAINDQQLTPSLYIRYYIVVKVLNLIQAYLIVSLSIIGCIDRLVDQDASLFILVSLMVFYGKYNIQWQSLALGINGSNNYSLLMITRLGQLSFTAIRAYNNYTYVDNAYYKASLVKVIGIII